MEYCCSCLTSWDGVLRDIRVMFRERGMSMDRNGKWCYMADENVGACK